MKAAFLLLAWFATWAIAAGQNPAAELSKRSGLPPDEVAKLLADCNANQQSMYFCTWRDQIAAEQQLQRVVDKKPPACKVLLERKLGAWKRKRDRGCQRYAEQQWGGGSFERTGELICDTDETKDMTKYVSVKKCSCCDGGSDRGPDLH